MSRGLEKLGVECAVIYGSLPPGTKLAMAERFNDPHDPCKVKPFKVKSPFMSAANNYLSCS